MASEDVWMRLFAQQTQELVQALAREHALQRACMKGVLEAKEGDGGGAAREQGGDTAMVEIESAAEPPECGPDASQQDKGGGISRCESTTLGDAELPAVDQVERSELKDDLTAAAGSAPAEGATSDDPVGESKAVRAVYSLPGVAVRGGEGGRDGDPGCLASCAASRDAGGGDVHVLGGGDLGADQSWRAPDGESKASAVHSPTGGEGGGGEVQVHGGESVILAACSTGGAWSDNIPHKEFGEVHGMGKDSMADLATKGPPPGQPGQPTDRQVGPVPWGGGRKDIKGNKGGCYAEQGGSGEGGQVTQRTQRGGWGAAPPGGGGGGKGGGPPGGGGGRERGGGPRSGGGGRARRGGFRASTRVVRPFVHREEDVHLVNAVSEHLGMGAFTCETRFVDGRWQSMYMQDGGDFFAGPAEDTQEEARDAAQWLFLGFFKNYKVQQEGGSA